MTTRAGEYRTSLQLVLPSSRPTTDTSQERLVTTVICHPYDFIPTERDWAMGKLYKNDKFEQIFQLLLKLLTTLTTSIA